MGEILFWMLAWFIAVLITTTDWNYWGEKIEQE